MYAKLGATGIVGVLLLVGGVGLIAWIEPIIAGGIALVLVGLALIAKGLISALLSSFGMGGLMGGGGGDMGF